MSELSDRVSRLEGAYEHLATKADIGEVKTEIANQVNKAIGILIGAIVAVVALFKYLPD